MGTNAQVGTPRNCGSTVAEVGANAKAEAGAWRPSLEGKNGERKGKSGNLWSLLELSMVVTEEGTFWERAI